MELEFLCLANSSKRGKRCIAGLRTNGGGWVRLVSRVGDGGLSDMECAYTDLTHPAVMDVVRAGVVEHRPQPHQPENWIVDGRVWERVRRADIAAEQALIQPFIACGPTILGSYKNKTPYRELFLKPKTESLTLVWPENADWRWEQGSSDRRLRVPFACNGAFYDLPVTDDVFEASLAVLSEGSLIPEMRLDHEAHWLFLISLSEPFDPTGGDNPLCYTLVASVMTAPANWAVTA